MNIKEKFGKIPFPGWLFVSLMVVYNEMMLHFWVIEEFHLGRMTVVASFAVAFGLALAFLTSLFSSRISKRVAVGLSLAVTVFWVMEYFVSDAYRVFMTPATILNGAGGVAQDYFGLIVSLLLRDLWRILLMLLPTVLYGLFCRSRRTGWKVRGLLLAGAVCFYLLGFNSVEVRTKDAGRLDESYNFDSAVRCFGLNVALGLETVHNSAEEEEPSFITYTPAPVETTAGTEVPTTQAAETEVPTTQAAETEVPPTTQTPETEPAAVTEAPVETQASQGAEETLPAAPVAVQGDNIIEALDFAALSQMEDNKRISTIHSYVASLTPTAKNEYTGMFRGKNLILITAEAFTREVIDPELTPTLYRMANEGIRFDDYYQPAWGASTTSGEFSNVVGLVPTTGGLCMKETTQQKLFLTMGHQMQKLGYYSTAYHNHLHDFYERNKTHVNLGYDRFIALYGGLEGVEAVWPESDLQLIDATVNDYIDQQPFSIYYMTVSGHCVYSPKGNAQSRKHFDKVAHLEYSDTVIVIATDHYPYGLERSGTWNNTSDYLRELYGVEEYDHFRRDSNALIIWSGCLEDQDIVVEEPVYSLDILPTLSNLFGVEYDSRLLVGRDVFSDAEPIVLWPDYSWKTDKGTYNAKTETFTPVEGIAVPDGYVEYISSQVANKITYSDSVLKTDYFNYLVKALTGEE